MTHTILSYPGLLESKMEVIGIIICAALLIAVFVRFPAPFVFFGILVLVFQFEPNWSGWALVPYWLIATVVIIFSTLVATDISDAIFDD